MFKLITLQDTIRIPPETFGKPLEKVGREQVKQKYEGIVDEELGYVIAVTGIQVSPIGKIIPGDGATFHKVNFSVLTFYPIIQEIVEGDVVEIADFGAFVRIGPIDALLHVSQLMDDFISYDEKQGVLLGKETKRKLTAGDQVRVRITAVSLGRAGSSGKIGVTARQPFLGKLEWLQMDQGKEESTEEKEEKTGQ
ncbi:MAG: DNA-directed RNA polymerase [Nitrososphaerota archaeon]|jgi:DNA-directed RNA polymerase subunit E'|uniref:DNA-directed RNA polymerase n=1 Tax=Candidatus Bathycorpusculum sp. TaxID=2994959 RepID=UPI0028316495|nr:DNA-directed RNA polymerase [Candidatus Termiticorpusculum sp.]MCL2257779.1 DNA-directed RNA polymerase [Candidatus Termiticorpusculum sp.]MCL2292083.1 DNA-directed RNA polymerase [Candidatus Termiticorpusculum sp.]MDR0460316.1 DNA-directed RNA polymerase [Nitrososphaerota archaeon]